MTAVTTTGNIAWDPRLEAFKGADTAGYVAAAAAVARTCGVCRRELLPDEPLSLLVDITRSTAPDGSDHLCFYDCLCHRSCSDPVLMFREEPWQEDKLSPLAARAVFAQNSGVGPARGTPVLAYTWYPVVSFQERGGGLVSALVSLLLSHGFQLALSPDYPDLLNQVQPTAASCKCTLTPDNFLKFSIDGELLHSEQLNPRTTDDAEWIAAATHTGQILMISGDHLRITQTRLDLQPAARQASLVIGNVPFTPALRTG